MKKGTVDRFENNKVVIEFDDLQIGVLPKDCFNEDIREGDEIIIKVESKHCENIDIDDLFE